MEKKLVYYAHPMSHYDTDLEKDCIEIIWEMLGGGYDDEEVEIELFNPNQLMVDRHISRIIEEGNKEYFDFFRELVKSCDIVVAVTFKDGMIGSGVADEAMTGLKYGKKVFLLTFDDDGNKMFFLIDDIEEGCVLSREETRERVRGENKVL